MHISSEQLLLIIGRQTVELEVFKAKVEALETVLAETTRGDRDERPAQE